MHYLPVRQEFPLLHYLLITLILFQVNLCVCHCTTREMLPSYQLIVNVGAYMKKFLSVIRDFTTKINVWLGSNFRWDYLPTV